MFPQWTYDEGEEDLTIMRIIVEGRAGGRERRLVWDVLDHYDAASRATSMSRTTAFPCAIITRMLVSGRIDQPGVNPPERLAHLDGLVDDVVAEHRARGVEYLAREELITSD
jgi:saccharopine dehydrogenase-like NADP-dependent oxidoreductase